jgi:hypothetical protein
MVYSTCAVSRVVRVAALKNALSRRTSSCAPGQSVRVITLIDGTVFEEVEGSHRAAHRAGLTVLRSA